MTQSDPTREPVHVHDYGAARIPCSRPVCMTPSDPTREALEQTYDALTKLHKQAGDGGGKRGEVYVTVQTWREAFQPIIANAGVVLRSAALPTTPTPSLRQRIEALRQIDSVRLDRLDLRREIEPSTLLVRDEVLAALAYTEPDE